MLGSAAGLKRRGLARQSVMCPAKTAGHATRLNEGVTTSAWSYFGDCDRRRGKINILIDECFQRSTIIIPIAWAKSKSLLRKDK